MTREEEFIVEYIRCASHICHSSGPSRRREEEAIIAVADFGEQSFLNQTPAGRESKRNSRYYYFSSQYKFKILIVP